MSFPSEVCTKNTPVGGNGGVEFNLVGKSGAFVRKIRVYHGTLKWGSGLRGCLNGIEVEFTNGDESSTGDTNSSQSFKEFYFDLDKEEKLKSFSLWGMGNGKWDRTSRMYFETTKGQKFDAGSKAENENEYKMELGSNILIGFKGRSGGGIDSIAPVFLRKVKRQYIDEITYPTLDLNDTSFLQMQVLQQATSIWDEDSATGKCTLNGDSEVTVTTTWNSKFTIETSIETQFTAGVPLLASGKITAGLKIGGQFDWGGSNSTRQSLKWQFEKEMNGFEDMFEAIATYYSGTKNVDYTGTFHIVTEDGKNYSFPTSGTLKNVLVSQIEYKTRKLSPETRSFDEDGTETGWEIEEPQIDNEDWAGQEDTRDGEERANDDIQDPAGEIENSQENGYAENGYSENGYSENGYARNDYAENEEKSTEDYEATTREDETIGYERGDEEASAEPAYEETADYQENGEEHSDYPTEEREEGQYGGDFEERDGNTEEQPSAENYEQEEEEVANEQNFEEIDNEQEQYATRENQGDNENYQYQGYDQSEEVESQEPQDRLDYSYENTETSEDQTESYGDDYSYGRQRKVQEYDSYGEKY